MTDRDYTQFSELVAERGSQAKGPLFTTDVVGLWDAYLNGIPWQHRQHYNCNRCREFITRYGGLAAVTKQGFVDPLLWHSQDVPMFFRNSTDAMFERVASKAKVTGIFLSSQEVWGTPFNVPGPPSKHQGRRWEHLHCRNPNVFKHPLRNAEQMMAEKLEDFQMLQRAIAEYQVAVVEQAVRVLEADALDRSEKTLGGARWFLELIQSLEASKRGPSRSNLCWLAVAQAPPGFCHVRTNVINTLLDDLKAGMPFDSVAKRWKEKMHPLQYQRPSAISDGNLEQANRIVEKLGTQGSLARRFARLEDVTYWHWQPRPVEEPQEAVKPFDSLKRSNRPLPAVELPEKKVTWEKFLPLLEDALEVWVKAPLCGAYFGMVTTMDPAAPCLLQWNNHFSWYFYYRGGYARSWNLQPDSWVKCNGITACPAHWGDRDLLRHQQGMAMFILDGCRDVSYQGGALFFPECLKSEYHEVRKAMELYSQRNKIADPELGTANGIAVQKGQEANLRVRVRTATGFANYIIDRWE